MSKPLAAVLRQEHTLPCGCVMVTENANVVDMRYCPRCQAAWDAAFVTTDQEIEDAIFGKSSE